MAAEHFTLRPQAELYMNRTFFHAFGSLPPVDINPFTLPAHVVQSESNTPSTPQDAKSPDPRGSESGHVHSLLLGCGDWRSIYFTCWLNRASPHEYDRHTKLDVTTCDRSAAIQARNLSFLRAILEYGEFELEHLWNIFFCVFLPSTKSSAILIDLLLKMKKSTQSMAAFQQSSLGPHVSIEPTSLPLLHDVYCMWFRMLSAKEMATDKVKIKRLHFLQTVLRGRPTATFLMPYMNTRDHRLVDEGLAAFEAGWTNPSAVLRGNRSGAKILPEHRMPVNPTMFEGPSYSYTMHYSVPFDCFSALSFGAFDENQFVRPECLAVSSGFFLLASCLEQFGRWIRASRLALETKQLHVRVFVGDAFDFCDLLRAKPPSLSGGYLIGSDVARRIAFLPDWPSRFEYINCSGLADDFSLLPVLVSAAPLLDLSFAESVLRTDLLRLSGSIASYLQTSLGIPL